MIYPQKFLGEFQDLLPEIPKRIPGFTLEIHERIPESLAKKFMEEFQDLPQKFQEEQTTPSQPPPIKHSYQVSKKTPRPVVSATSTHQQDIPCTRHNTLGSTFPPHRKRRQVPQSGYHTQVCQKLEQGSQSTTHPSL